MDYLNIPLNVLSDRLNVTNSLFGVIENEGKVSPVLF